MRSKMKQFCKKMIMVVAVAAILICNVQVMPVQAATDAEKEAFRQLVIEMLMTGDSSVHNIRQYNLTFPEYTTIFWDVVDNECKIVYQCYANQVPQSTRDGNYMDTFWLYNSDPGFPERYANMLASMEEVHSGLDDTMSDLEKTLYIHDWLVRHTTYIMDEETMLSWVPGGPLGLGYGVCAGYESAMRLLLEQEGIECTEITNKTHGWLAVKLDGEWYHIDPTWDDTRSIRGEVSHKYFLRNDAEITTDHKNWKYQQGSGHVEGQWQGTMVSGTLSTSTKYSDWYVHNIVGDMFYDGGNWYYIENGSIVKNNIEGTAYESVVSGSNLKIVSLDNGILKYDDNGTVYEKILNESGNTEDSGNTGKTTGWIIGSDGELRLYDDTGKMVTNQFAFDGTYTYYLQADGTPMKDRLTYHPDGEHIIYLDENGHEVFNAFQYCPSVGYICYFDSQGYIYKDQITFVGDKVYYLNANGKMENSGWFQFANGMDYGYANGDGTLNTGGFSYDPWGRIVFYHWNGMVARGLITDGIYYYNMDLADGHYLGSFPVN